jgi:hypothetical protein
MNLTPRQTSTLLTLYNMGLARLMERMDATGAPHEDMIRIGKLIMSCAPWKSFVVSQHVSGREMIENAEALRAELDTLVPGRDEIHEMQERASNAYGKARSLYRDGQPSLVCQVQEGAARRSRKARQWLGVEP